MVHKKTIVLDILIPLGKGSVWQDNELRFCLRSIEKFLSGYDNIFIIGQKPEWLTGVIHIPHTDLQQSRFRDYNIYLKVIAGCHDERLSDDFLFMSDDHFITKKFHADALPYYYCGQLVDYLYDNPRKMPYVNVLLNTYKYLNGLNKPTLNFNLHCPIIYNKEKFSTVFPQPWPEYGFALKSIYCNILNIEGKYYEDLKIKEDATLQDVEKLIADRYFFSIADSAIRRGNMKTILPILFPSPSKYELYGI